MWMRGGTSKGLMFRREDLPADRADWDPIFLKLMGSPDPNGRQLLERRFVTSAPKPVQLFAFGAGRSVLVISETGPGKAYLYDSAYRLVGGQPFDSHAATVGLSYDAEAGTYQLFRILGAELRRLALRME